MGSGPGNPSRILVVDDEPFIVQLVADMLSEAGYDVDTAENGLIALEQIRQRSYDLILSDLRMPALDGLGLYREVEQEWPDLRRRMVFISGTLDQPEYQRFIEASGVPILSKPFDMDELRDLAERRLAELA